MLRAEFDPRMPTPEMNIANKYITRLGWLGSQLLALCWAFATINVSTSVLVTVGVACGLYLAYIGREYRHAYSRIMASLSKIGRLRLFAKAWPAFVAIVIVSGLAVGAFTWQQMGELKMGLLGVAVIPYATWILKKLLGE